MDVTVKIIYAKIHADVRSEYITGLNGCFASFIPGCCVQAVAAPAINIPDCDIDV